MCGLFLVRPAWAYPSMVGTKKVNVSAVVIRVRGVGLAAGPWMAAALGTLIPNMWNTDATAMWTTNANPMWSS